MGRIRPNKPRRSRRPAPYELRDLQPPGRFYEEWFYAQPSGETWKTPTGSRLAPEELAFLDRLGALGPLYGQWVPYAAFILDTMTDTGKIAILHDEGSGRLVSLDEIAQTFPVGADGDVRNSLHRLHAIGAFLIVDDEENDSAFIRFVAQRPEKPGDPWFFMGDSSVAVSTVCLPHTAAAELSADVFGTVAYLRACEARLEEADANEYAKHKGVNGPDHARELFAAARASGYVDFKGCDACPAGHLCTRQDEPADG